MSYVCIQKLPQLKHCYSGFYMAPRGWKHKHMLLLNYEIMVGVSGTYQLRVDEKLHTVAPGSIILLKPGETVVGEKYSDTETTFYWLHFESDHTQSLSEVELSQFLAQQSNLADVAIVPRFAMIKDLPAVEILMRQISVFREDECYSSLPADLLTANLLIQLSHRTVLKKTSIGEPRLIRQIKEWIHIRLNQNVSLADVAIEFKLSREHISRTFKKHTGITLTQYITDKRIEYTKSLLASGKYSVKQVANKAGFTDEKYYSYVFTKNQGISPSAYRKTLGTHM